MPDKIDSLLSFYDNGIKDMSQQMKMKKEILDCQEDIILQKELEIIEWSMKYIEEKRSQPSYKKTPIDEKEVLQWCDDFQKERKSK